MVDMTEKVNKIVELVLSMTSSDLDNNVTPGVNITNSNREYLIDSLVHSIASPLVAEMKNNSLRTWLEDPADREMFGIIIACGKNEYLLT